MPRGPHRQETGAPRLANRPSILRLTCSPGLRSPRAAAHRGQAFEAFIAMFAPKYPAAVDCLKKDREVLLTFYDFPAEHWVHLRTTNPIESTFATVRLRHRRTKGNGTRLACLTMVFKLTESAARKWRAINGAKLLPEVIAGVRFVDGERPEKTAA
ncbi:MAG TPA: transposase [Phycisphaerae bacterium]|nr:transposase [Phycisphaerae bacterium]